MPLSAAGWRCGLLRQLEFQNESPTLPAGAVFRCLGPPAVRRLEERQTMSSTQTAEALPSLVGSGTQVPLVGGGSARYADLDHTASTPALAGVWHAVEAFMPWYASVHRGDGGRCRQPPTRPPVRLSPSSSIRGPMTSCWSWGTRRTPATSLPRCLPAGTVVVTTFAEHHANMPALAEARRRRARRASREGALVQLEAALRALPAGRPALVAVTGASNVTGEVWPVAETAALAHRYGPHVAFVDAAQLAPHRPST